MQADIPWLDTKRKFLLDFYYTAVFRMPVHGDEISHIFSPFFCHRFFVPFWIFVVSYVLRLVADYSCSPFSQTCRNTSDLLSHTTAVVFFFMIILGLAKAFEAKEAVKGAYNLVVGGGGKQKKD